SPAERNAIHLSFIASFLLLMLSFHTGPSGDRLILSLDLPARVTVPARAVLALSFVGASGWALVSMARRGRLGAILAPLTLTFTPLVNIHHFILDGALWKLRDSRVAAFLLNTNEKTPGAELPARGAWPSAARWLTGSTPAARGLRIAAGALLLAWAAMDQLHF